MHHFLLLALRWLAAAPTVPAQFPTYFNAGSRFRETPSDTKRRWHALRRADAAGLRPFVHLLDGTSPAPGAARSARLRRPAARAAQPGAGLITFPSAG
jgi:hypothetical protein